jgi:hypothetical protein
MKRLAMALTVLIAAPLFAAEKAAEKKEEPKPESPLVAAAKRTNRQKSTTPIITNATVKTSKGHITTTTITRIPVIPVPAPSAEVKHIEAQARIKAEAAKAEAEARAKEKKQQDEMARKAAAYESGEDSNEENEVFVPPPDPL